MREITLPVTDVNSETASVMWCVEDGASVERGDLVATAETSKAVIDIEAPVNGLLLQRRPDGSEVAIDAVIGLVCEDLEEFEEQRRHHEPAPEPGRQGPGQPRATRSAIELAAQHGIDLASLPGDGLLTSRDVEAALATSTGTQPVDLPDPLPGDGRRRLLLVGAGLGATQVIDILTHDPSQSAVAIVDDESMRWGDEVEGVPVVGGRSRIAELVSNDAVDAAVIAISTSVEVRSTMRAWCEELGLPLANVVDPTARIATGVQMGEGNVICAFCHVGVGAVVGHNNFFSAYNSFDHHSTLGSDISTGPGCMTSGLVTIGDRARFGTGVFVEPKVRIGDGAVVASGSIVVVDVPDDHVVRAKAGATVISPLRR